MTRGRVTVLRLALSVLGLGIATYLTLLHYFTQVPLVCSVSGIVDCSAVLTSPQSVILGVPIAIFGLVWFLGSTGLSIAGMRGSTASRGRLRSVWTVWTALGALSVVYLVYLELMVIGRICLWCSGVHLIVLSMLALQVFADREPEPDTAGG